MMNTSLSYGFAVFLIALFPFAQAEAKCEVPKADRICIDQKPEARRSFAPGKTLPPLAVAVRYGHKNVSPLLGESQYAPDYAPGLLQRRLVSDLTASGLFASVYGADSASDPSAYKLTIVMEPMMKLTPASEAIGVGSVGLFPLLGGELTTEFELTLHSSLQRRDGSKLASNRLFMSGMTTSTLYKEQQNVDRSWQQSIDFTVPSIYNFVIAEMRRGSGTPPNPQAQSIARARGSASAELGSSSVSPSSGGRSSDLPDLPVKRVLPPVKDLQVLEIQRLLTRLGYAPGPVDGIMGRRTREAIRQYQRHSAMPVDGKPSASLVANLKAGIARPSASAPPEETNPKRQERSDDDLDNLETLDDF